MKLRPPLSRYFAVAFVCAISLGYLNAQIVQFNTISISEGLSQATIKAIEQDEDGFMWIGTGDGLNRYDGYSFVVLKNAADSASLSSNAITALKSAGENTLWVGTGFGLNKLNTKTMRSTAFYQWFEDSLSISSNKIRAIELDKLGRVWVGTENGLNRLSADGTHFIRYSIREDDETSLSNNFVTDLMTDELGRLWVATQGGLNLYDSSNDSFIRYRFDFEDANSLSSNEVNCLYEDSDGLIWIGTNNGLNKFNPELNIFKRYYKNSPKQNLLNSNTINSIVEDETGKIWIGTPSGLNLLSGSEVESLSFRSGAAMTNSLPNDHILKLCIDNSGMVWVGTLSAGIATINQESPQFSDVRYAGSDSFEPAQNAINSFCEIDTNEFWIGTDLGLVRYNLNLGTSKFFADIPQSALAEIDVPINAIVNCDSIIWFGTGGKGLISYRREKNSLTYYMVSEDPTGISSNKINDLVIDKEGTLWIATSGGGLCSKKSNKEDFEVYKFKGDDPSSLRDNNVSALALTKSGKLWIGTGNAGLYFLDLKEKVLKPWGTQKKGIGNRINDLYLDDSSQLWIATTGSGLSVLGPNALKYISYTDSSGLSNNTVLGLSQDYSGNIWLSTNSGLSAFNQATSTFRNYSQDGVLGKNTFRARSAYRGSNGTLFFGGANGFDYFNSIGLKENSFVPPVSITGCQLLEDSEKNSPLELARNVRDKLVLDYNHSGFTLEFAALNFKQPEKNQYAFRMSGLFDQWRYTGTRRYATFSNLNPGTYVFEVIGSNNDGLWNETPATLTVEIIPAFWQTNWFRLMAVIAVLGGLYLFYRYRLRSEHERTVQLEAAVTQRTTEIAKERDTNVMLLKEIHHRVKNNLQIIVSLLSLQSRFITNNELHMVFNEIQNRVRSMSLIHEKMYKTKDLRTVNIEEYISDLSNSLIHTYQIGQQIELDVQVEVNSFKADTLTPLGLIINEIISNALKYAFEEDKAGKIFVRIKKIEGVKYQMIIGDDGIGMPHSNLDDSGDSFGTELIGALTEQLNGTIKLLDSDKGTVYEIIFEDVDE